MFRHFKNSGEAGRPFSSLFVLFPLICLLAFLVASTCSNKQQVNRITIAQFGDFFLYAPLYIAIDAGYFRKEGLEVSLISTGGDEKTWAAVVSGNASFGIADPTFVAISAQRGQPGKVVATLVNRVPFWGVTFKSNIPEITEPKQLNDFVVATFPAPSTAYTLQKQMFVEAGLKPNIRQGSFGTLFAMLEADEADIALELEPNVSQAVSRGAKVVYSLNSIYGEFAITGLTTIPSIIERRPELVQKVVRALANALIFIRNQPEESVQILVKRFPEVKPAIGKAALDRSVADGVLPEQVYTTRKAWDRAVALRVSAGDLKEPKEFAFYVDNSFATQVLDQNK